MNLGKSVLVSFIGGVALALVGVWALVSASTPEPNSASVSTSVVSYN